MFILVTIFMAQVVIYGLFVWLLSRQIEKLERFSRSAIFLACLLVGLLSGLLTAWLWPRLDSVIYPNMAAFIMGEAIYNLATSTIPAGTTSPHQAISWLLRVPQVFVTSSILLLGAAGAVMQLLYNHRTPAGSNLSAP
jgi:hypothetical protein